MSSLRRKPVPGLSEQREAGIIPFLCPWSARLPGAPASTLPGRKSCGKELTDPLGRHMFLNERRVRQCQMCKGFRMGKMGVGVKGKGGMILHLLNICCESVTVLVTLTSVNLI